MDFHRACFPALLTALFVLLLAAVSCKPKASKPALSPADAQRAAGIYASSHCDVCHGDQLQGKPNYGPAINGIGAKWPASDELEKYLADPQGYKAANPRLAGQQGQFMMKMPALPLSDADRKLLAAWLLAQ